MNHLLLAAPESTESAAGHRELTAAQILLKQMVLDSVTSQNTRRSYSLTLDELFAFSAGFHLVERNTMTNYDWRPRALIRFTRPSEPVANSKIAEGSGTGEGGTGSPTAL
jgi:hypothetical protein